MNPQKTICFYFQVHQPYRLSENSFFDDPEKKDYFEGPKNMQNRAIFEKVARKCYIPTTTLILELLKKHPEFRVSYSLSGVFLDQCEEYGEIGKQVLDLFKAIARTGQAEFLCETYYHSLAFLFSKEEYAVQIRMQAQKIKELFGQTPKIFRNTELVYNNEIAEFVRQMGFKGMLAEGWEKYLQERNPGHLYHAHKIEIHEEDKKIAKKYKIHARAKTELPLLLKNYKLSDDIAFRFSNQGWEEYPLNTEKFGHWVESSHGETINLFMDYETFGEHQWESTGIFAFLAHLPQEMKKRNIGFRTPSETIKALENPQCYDVPHYLSWADTDRDLSAWMENDIQKSALEELRELEKIIHAHKAIEQLEMQNIVRNFRRLQTSDNFYYMCTKYFQDGDVHKYFSPYKSDYSPYEAYIYYMNTLRSVKNNLNTFLLTLSKND